MCCVASSLALPLLAAIPARAHGGPPSALGIVAADADGQPSMVILNEGLAFADVDGWTFLCPRLWGDADTSSGKSPLARSLDGIESWIIGADDLYSARDGVLTARGYPELSSASVVALAADDDALFGLTVGSEGSAIVRIDDPAEPSLFTSTEVWTSLAIAAGRVHLARMDEGELARATLDREGRVTEEQRIAVPATIAQLRLRPTARGLFAVALQSAHYALAAIEETTWRDVLQSPGPIHGPQASTGGTLWVAVNGELMREAGAGFETAGEARRVTCLEQWGSLVYACAGSELYRLGDDGLQERLFRLDHLSEPDPALVPPAATRDCDFQWLLYRNDLERTGLSPRDRDDATADAGSEGGGDDAAAGPDSTRDAAAPESRPSNASDGGCSAAGARGAATPSGCTTIAFAGLLLARARRRAKGRA